VQLIQEMLDGGYEQIVHCADRQSGLRCIIAVHSTALGPSLGGVRYLPYPDEAAALADVLRLAKAMTYKAAAAGLDQGGGKAVVIGDPAGKTDALLKAFGQFVDSLGGRYYTAEDVGTTQADMDTIRSVTPYVTGCSLALGGSGDPSEATAVGVHEAIRAVDAGPRVVILGVGKVGTFLARRLVADGYSVTVADINPARVDALRSELGVATVPPEHAHRVTCDVFSPCALGGVLSPSSIRELACRAVVGAANNQLVSPSDASLLHDRGIVYVPDYIANAGGIINIASELRGARYDLDVALANVMRIGDTTRQLLAEAAELNITPLDAATRLVEQRLAAAGAPGIRTFPRS
jgi:glutamate dehydrogenase/leucine dehydrogenase